MKKNTGNIKDKKFMKHIPSQKMTLYAEKEAIMENMMELIVTKTTTLKKQNHKGLRGLKIEKKK